MPKPLVVTRKMIRSLAWIKQNQPVAWFDKKKGPSLRYTKRLESFGLVIKLKRLIPHPEISDACIAQFKLHKEGRRVLRDNRHRLK